MTNKGGYSWHRPCDLLISAFLLSLLFWYSWKRFGFMRRRIKISTIRYSGQPLTTADNISCSNLIPFNTDCHVPLFVFLLCTHFFPKFMKYFREWRRNIAWIHLRENRVALPAHVHLLLIILPCWMCPTCSSPPGQKIFKPVWSIHFWIWRKSTRTCSCKLFLPLLSTNNEYSARHLLKGRLSLPHVYGGQVIGQVYVFGEQQI